MCPLASFKGVLILYNQSLYFAELSSRFSSVLLWPLTSFSILVITTASLSLSLKCWRSFLSTYIPSDLCHPHSYQISLSNHDAIVQRFPNSVLESPGMLVKHRGPRLTEAGMSLDFVFSNSPSDSDPPNVRIIDIYQARLYNSQLSQ